MRLRRPFHPLLVLGCIILALCPALGTLPTVSAVSSTFVVNTTVDAPDAAPGDGICATGAGQCSARAAVQVADA